MEIIPEANKPMRLKKYTFLNKKKVLNGNELYTHLENVILFYFYKNVNNILSKV